MNIASLDYMLRGSSWVTSQTVCSLMDDMEKLHVKPMPTGPRAVGQVGHLKWVLFLNKSSFSGIESR